MGGSGRARKNACRRAWLVMSTTPQNRHELMTECFAAKFCFKRSNKSENSGSELYYHGEFNLQRGYLNWKYDSSKCSIPVADFNNKFLSFSDFWYATVTENLSGEQKRQTYRNKADVKQKLSKSIIWIDYDEIASRFATNHVTLLRQCSFYFVFSSADWRVLDLKDRGNVTSFVSYT